MTMKPMLAIEWELGKHGTVLDGQSDHYLE
jgi:hypothetical protein